MITKYFNSIIKKNFMTMKNLQYIIKTCSFLLFFLMAFSATAQSTGVVVNDEGVPVLLKHQKVKAVDHSLINVRIQDAKKAENKAVDKQSLNLLDKKEYLNNRTLHPIMKKKAVLKKEALKKNSLKRDSKTNSN